MSDSTPPSSPSASSPSATDYYKSWIAIMSDSTPPSSPSASSPSATDYYKSWIAYGTLQEAVKQTNYQTVWSLLSCSCCPEPHCWTPLEIRPLGRNLQGRIRWYDHVNIPSHRPLHDDDNDPSTGIDQLSSDQVRDLQVHFVGHHQRIELILMALKPSIEKIYTILGPYKGDLSTAPEFVALQIIQECQYASNGWYSVGQLVRGVSKMDRIQYLKYVPRLAGVSGGNSPLMMQVTYRTAHLESLFETMKDEELGRAIRTQNAAGRIAQAFMDLLDSLSRCWMDHVVTATTVIGITSGTKGTPNVILVERAMKRLHNSRLLKALGNLRAPLSGIGVEMKQLHEYQTYPLAEHYLDLFDDPGPEFGSHNVGYQPREYDLAKGDYTKLRRSLRTGIWEHYYTDTRPQLCNILSEILGVRNEDIHFGFGSSVTEVISRITSTLVQEMDESSMTVIIAEDEFVTLQRAAISLCRNGASIALVPSGGEMGAKVLEMDQSMDEEKKQESDLKAVVFVSLVNSCTQLIKPLGWIERLSESIVVIIDITQAIANVCLMDYALEKLIVRPNVFVVGSLVKHARCGESLGFLTAASNDCVLSHPNSGWTSYLSGLRQNKTVVFPSRSLLYDEPLEWSGGTPGNVEAAYVANRILRSMPSIKVQHEYVQSLKSYFLHRARHLLSEDQINHVSASNTLAIPVASPPKTNLPFGIDFKVVNEVVYIRIGFGVHNLQHHVGELVADIEQLGTLK